MRRANTNLKFVLLICAMRCSQYVGICDDGSATELLFDALGHLFRPVQSGHPRPLLDRGRFCLGHGFAFDRDAASCKTPKKTPSNSPKLIGIGTLNKFSLFWRLEANWRPTCNFYLITYSNILITWTEHLAQPSRFFLSDNTCFMPERHSPSTTIIRPIIDLLE